MFLQLYDKNHNKIAGLAVAKAATVESVLSTGDGTLSFLYPLKEAAQLVNEAYIRTKTDEYIIKEVQPDSSDLWCSVKATLNVEDLEGICWPRFESVEQKIDDCLKLAIAGTGWAIGSCTVTRRRTIRKTECSGWDIIQQARKTYRCEIWFDTIEKKIHITEKRGQDKGMYFTDTLNLRKLTIQSTSYDFCTRIKAEGKDGLTFKEINGGKDYVENHQYSNKVLTKYWKDERYTNAQSLLEDTTAKLEELSKPVVAYSGDVLDLAKASPKTYRILDFGLGDTVELVDSTTGTKEKQRIVKMVEYPDEPERNTCEFANRTASFEELQQEQNEVNSTVNNITADDGTISPSALDLDAITIHVQNIYAQELNAVKARIGELETTTLKATEAIINTAMIEELLAGKATILDLNALTARVEVAEIKVGYVDTLVSDVADIKTLVNGNLTSVNIQAGGITSDSLTIRNGFITNAMIGSVEAGKITTGILNTSLVTVQGADGRMAIKDNTIQIKDASRVRVQIGKDAAGDYSMYVWDAAGALMFDAAGLHAPGIKSGIIRNDMVADNAGIAGTKIDIVSLITSINGNTTKIDSTVIKMDSSGQTLNLAFNTLKTTAETAKSTTETHTTQINAINGKIDTLIQDTTIIKDGQTVKLKDEYNKTVATVGGIQTTIGNQQTTIANLTNDLNNLSIGGRNLLRNSGNPVSNADYETVFYNVAVPLKPNTIYTVVMNGFTSTTAKRFGLWFNRGTGQNFWFDVTTTAKTQVIKITTPASFTTNTISIFNYPSTTAGTGTINWMTMYEGDIKPPLDWTPAPEDTQGQIAEVKTQQATFEQTLNGFKTTVSSLQTTVNSKADAGAVNTLNSRVTSLETNLDGFKTTVSNTYTTKTDFNNLSVGGRNLLKDTVSYASWSLGNCNKTLGQTDPYGSNKAVLISGNTQANSYILKTGQVLYKKGYHTLSVWLKGTKAGQVYVSFNNGGSRNMNAGKLCTLTTEWQRFEITENTTTLNNVYAFVLGGWSSWTDLSLGVYMAFPMLTEGNKAMPWTPAPEDVDASITAVDSKFASYSTTMQMNSAIDQKANQITQTVSQTYTTKTEFSNLQIGVRNILRNSGGSSANANYNTRNYETSSLKPNTKYTFVINGFTSAATQRIGVWFNGGTYGGFKLPVTTTAKTQYIVVTTPASFTTKQVNIYNYPSGSTRCVINWAAMYEGDIRPPMDWTPAKEDTDSYIDGLTTRMSTAEQKLTATSLITTITTGINGGTKFTTTKFIMDNTGLTIKGGGLRIQNNAGTNVLWADTNGNLQQRGDFYNYDNAGKLRASMTDSAVNFYDENGTFISNMGATYIGSSTDLKGIRFYTSKAGKYFSWSFENSSSSNASVGMLYAKEDAAGWTKGLHVEDSLYVRNGTKVDCSASEYVALSTPGYGNFNCNGNLLLRSDGYVLLGTRTSNTPILRSNNDEVRMYRNIFMNDHSSIMHIGAACDLFNVGTQDFFIRNSNYLHICCNSGVSINNYGNSGWTEVRASNFASTSQEKYKTNIREYTGVLSIMRNSKIYEYNLKTDLERGIVNKNYGFIIERETPQQVTDHDNIAINLYSMAGLNWQATKEIILENDLRDAKIEHLQREIGELKSKIWQLEQRLRVA